MFKIILPVRYLLKRRISYFSVAAVALCVFVVLVVMTVLSGLTAEFKTNTHSFVGDCVVRSKSLVGFGYYDEFINTLEKTDFVQAASPVIKNYALVSGPTESGFQEAARVKIIGVDPAAHSRVTGFAQWLYYNKDSVSGAFTPGYKPYAAGPGAVPGIDFLLNRDSQGRYQISPEPLRGRLEVSCVPRTAKGALAKAGTSEISTKTFYYSDIARTGLARVDGSTVYLPFEDAQLLCGMAPEPKRVNAIHVKFKPGISLDKGVEKVRGLWQQFAQHKAAAKQGNLLEKVTVQSWKTYSRTIIAAVETEQIMMSIVFAMIGIITVFIVFVVFYMIVAHKSKDIGILKSVGVSNTAVLKVFLDFALLVGIIGSAIGALAGWQFLAHINQLENWLFNRYGFQLWNRAMYAIGEIPNNIDLKVLAGIIISAVTTCLAGALIPAWQAARLKPVDTLQVNQL